MVEKVFVDDDGLVRTCIVSYRLVRQDLPEKTIRLYKGITYKEIKVAIQRLVMLLPIEEQEESRRLTDEELFRVEQDYAEKCLNSVKEIKDFCGYSQDELLAARNEAIAREDDRAARRGEGSMSITTVMEIQVKMEEESCEIPMEMPETPVYEEAVGQVFNSVEHVKSRNALISQYKASKHKRKRVYESSATIKQRVKDCKEFELLTREIKEWKRVD